MDMMFWLDKAQSNGYDVLIGCILSNQKAQSNGYEMVGFVV
jgi:hypothetical protein